MSLANSRLWNRYMNPIDYVNSFSRMPEDDAELFEHFFEAQEDFGVQAMSLDSIGVFNLGMNITTAMGIRGKLRPGGQIDHLEHTYSDILFMASFLGYEKIFHGRDANGNQVNFYTHEPFEKYDTLISKLGDRHSRDTLERTWRSTRAIAGNMLAPADYPYQAVCAFFVGETFSSRKSICIRAWNNMLTYVEHGGFFASAVILESEDFVTPYGIHIPMGKFTESELRNAFDQMPVKYKVYITSGKNDIRPGYNRIALIAGRTK